MQLHALMMGAGPDPEVLTNLIGTAGVVGYAKDPDTIFQRLPQLLEPALFPYGGLDLLHMYCLHMYCLHMYCIYSPLTND